MDYVIAIPSYKRADTLARLTLPFLKAQGIDPKRITVFVADYMEEAVYSTRLDRTTYNNIVVACPGMGAVRNYITGYYPEGTKLFCIDDDIKEVYRIISKKERMVMQPGGLHKLITVGFDAIGKVGIGMFGVYPVPNPYFMLKDAISIGLLYIIGSMYGVINDHSICVTMDDKEDYERSILQFKKYGSVMRFNWVSPDTSYYKEPGGMQVERTTDGIRESANRLIDMYPNLCHINSYKKSKYPEVRLSRKYKKSIPPDYLWMWDGIYG